MKTLLRICILRTFILFIMYNIVLIYFDSFDFTASQITETKIYHYTHEPYINRMIILTVNIFEIKKATIACKNIIIYYSL